MAISDPVLDLAHACRWLKEVADAASRSVIVSARMLDDGGWLVSERWPSHLAFLEHARNLQTLEAMVEEDRRSRCH
jgi:hypothetical protein